MADSKGDATSMTGMDIPSLPGGLASVLSVAGSEDATAEDVAQAIMLDPGLSTKVLRMANSAFYGRLTRAETVTEAVVTLGFGAVRTIALAASVVEHILPEESVPGLSWQAFWKHCVSTGASAELLLRQMTGSRRNGEVAFVAGLLHDVGKLVVARNAPTAFAASIQAARVNGGDSITAETEVLGTDHSLVGAMLAEAWRIPDVIATAISSHHCDADPAELDPTVAAVRAGNIIAKLAQGSYLAGCEVTQTAADAAAAAGVAPQVIAEVLEALPERLLECEEVTSWGSGLPGAPAMAA